MTVLEYIDARLAVHRKRLSRAEGKYRKLGDTIPERYRTAVCATCRRELEIVSELEGVREEVERGDDG